MTCWPEDSHYFSPLDKMLSMLSKACLKKILMGESKLQSSNCKMVLRARGKPKSENAPPFCKTSQNC